MHRPSLNCGHFTRSLWEDIFRDLPCHKGSILSEPTDDMIMIINHVTRHQSCDASSIMRCLWYFRLSIELMCSAAFVDAFGSSFERNILIHQTMYNGILKLSISVTGCISWTILPWRIYRLLAFSDLSGVEKRGHVDPTPGYVLTFYLVQLIFIVYLKYFELCTLSSWANVV